MNYPSNDYSKSKKTIYKILSVILLTSVFLSNSAFFLGQFLNINQVEAATIANPPATPIGSNMVKGSSFETDINSFWQLWNNSSRTMSVSRSYDSAFGQGSYSLAVDAKGAATARTDAGLVTNNSNVFLTQSGKTYVLRFFAKSTAPASISAMLENANTFAGETPLVEQAVTTDWQQYSIAFTPTVSSDTASLLTFFIGDLPDGSTLNLDGLTMQEVGYKLSTTEIKGYIGDTKSLNLNNLSLLSENDVDIELPYYDNLTSKITIKKFKPSSLSGNSVSFKLPTQTFPGLGKIYVLGSMVGQFDYNVLPKVVEFYPSKPRADQDLSIKVSGLNPNPDTSFVIIKAVNISGKSYDQWIKPDSFDSQLAYATVKLPVGVMSGGLILQTSFQNLLGKVVENKTAAVAYKVMPVIYQAEWSSKGFEQVGDKLKIHGKGISNRPTVNFYDSSDKLVLSKQATLLDINATEEVIEVSSLPNLTVAKITVTVDGVETDSATALSYAAKPRLTLITTNNRRIMAGSGESLPAAKIGEEVSIFGSAFNSTASNPVMVEFQGVGQRFTVAIDAAKVDAKGGSLKVTIPNNAQTGFVTVISSGQKANFLPLEIIPKVVSVAPNPIVPGETMTINAQGVGNNLNLLKVVFNLTSQEKVEVVADTLTVNDTGATIVLKAPLAISNNNSSINIKYDRWQDDGAVNLNVHPTITNADINLDDSILVIKGYGFSINPNENLITYKYADTNHTVITPRVQMLGVYPTEDGQEIRIKILDNYRYGYVSVKTGEFSSNEANFGPVSIKKVVRRVELIPALNQTMGVLYIYGYNFDMDSDVRIGSVWADIQSQSQFYIKAVVDKANLYDNPIIITKK